MQYRCHPGLRCPGQRCPAPRAPRLRPADRHILGQRHTCVSTRTTTAGGEGVPEETGRALSEVNLSVSTLSLYIVNITIGFLRSNVPVVILSWNAKFESRRLQWEDSVRHVQ